MVRLIIHKGYFVILQVAKCYVPIQIFLSQPKNLTAFSASSKTFVLAQKQILLNANHLFVWHKIFVNRFLGWIKKFGPAQNVLGPVKRQGKSVY